MPIPEFTEHGLLPPGIYDCTFEEMDERFGQNLWVNNRLVTQRSQLCERLRAYFADLNKTGLVISVIADGSFVTTKDAPNDIDLIVVLPADHDFNKELRPFEYNAFSKKQVHKRYGFDLFVVPENSAAYADWQAFFEQVRNRPDLRKGLLRLRP